MIASFAVLCGLMAAPQPAQGWIEGKVFAPMWLTCDVTTKVDFSRAPDQRYYKAVYRVNGQQGTMGYGYIYGLLEDRARTSLDRLQSETMKAMFETMPNGSQVRTSDSEFTQFAAGAGNGWTSFKSRRIEVDNTVNGDLRHNRMLIVFDGYRRVWTFVTSYYDGDKAGEAASTRLLSSIRLMNRCDFVEGAREFHGTVDPKGRVKIDQKGDW